MSETGYTTEYWVDATPETVYAAIVDVPSFWAPPTTVVNASVEGDSAYEGDEFIYRDRAFHHCRIRVERARPGRQMVWRVIEAADNETEQVGAPRENAAGPHEWAGTRMLFTLTPHNGGTRLRFVHEGLTPALKCYNGCSRGWDGVINDSLKNLITTGAAW